MLRKKPTLLKLLCALVVFIGLFICLIPTIFPEVDPKAEKTKNAAHGVSRVMWPIIFMLGFVSVFKYIAPWCVIKVYRAVLFRYCFGFAIQSFAIG